MTDSVNTIGWSFARGVGITSLSYNGQSLNISSFYVNTQTSQSELRAPASIRPSEVRFVSAGEAAALLKALF
jgi:hypothetical protein